MNIISFHDIYTKDYQLKHLFSMNQKWPNQHLFTMQAPRKTSALLFYEKGTGVYTFSDQTVLNAPEGSVVYIPEGCTYCTRFQSTPNTRVHTKLLEFEMTDLSDIPFAASRQPVLLPTLGIGEYPELFEDLVETYTSPFYSYSLMKSKVYRFLYEICKVHHQERIFSKTYMPIAKGILYLEQDASNRMSIAEIAAMCNVDESCFRRLFKQYSGLSPSEYRLQNMIRHAKALLRSGDMNVTEVAARLGYHDSAYFSRVFKKKTGTSPSEYMK